MSRRRKVWLAVAVVLLVLGTAFFNVLTAPFRLIGRLFTSSDDKVEELRVEPVTFAAGSSAIAYQRNVPGVTLPKTVDEQLAALRQREPTPAGPLAALLKRRLDATRERLTKAEGVQPGRLVAAAAAPPAAGDGRVEFEIREGEE